MSKAEEQLESGSEGISEALAQLTRVGRIMGQARVQMDAAGRAAVLLSRALRPRVFADVTQAIERFNAERDGQFLFALGHAQLVLSVHFDGQQEAPLSLGVHLESVRDRATNALISTAALAELDLGPTADVLARSLQGFLKEVLPWTRGVEVVVLLPTVPAEDDHHVTSDPDV